MTDEQPGGSHSPGGFPEHLRELFAAGAEYLHARLALAGIETREALLHFGIILALFISAVTVSLFGYLFLCIALTVLLAQLLNVSPGWVILALAVIHFVLALGAVLFAVARLRTAVFSATLSELKKDQQWLTQASK